MKTYVATKNAGKLRELRRIFGGSALDLDTYGAYGDVAEGAESYESNALLKARALARQLRVAGIAAAVLGDDSGLEAQALNGRPGVLSARYAGADATWAQRRARLLAEMANVPRALRGARFVCTMALILPDGSELTAVGTVDGAIAEAELGTSGFGYDSIFWCPPRGCTFAQLAEEEKNAVSHRRVAARALLRKLAERG